MYPIDCHRNLYYDENNKMYVITETSPYKFKDSKAIIDHSILSGNLKLIDNKLVLNPENNNIELESDLTELNNDEIKLPDTYFDLTAANLDKYKYKGTVLSNIVSNVNTSGTSTTNFGMDKFKIGTNSSLADLLSPILTDLSAAEIKNPVYALKHEKNILTNETNQFKLGQEINNTNSGATHSRSFNTFGNYCGLEQSNETNNPLGGLFSPAYYEENVGIWIDDGTVHGSANADFLHNGHNGSTTGDDGDDTVHNSGLGFTGVNSIEASFSTLGVLNADKINLPIWCNGIIGLLIGAGGYGGTATNDGDDRNSGGSGGGGGTVLFKTISFENDGNYYYSIRTGGVAMTTGEGYSHNDQGQYYYLSTNGSQHYHGPAGGDSVFMLWYKDTITGLYHLMYMAAAQGGRGVAFRASDGYAPSYAGWGGGTVIYAKITNASGSTSEVENKVYSSNANNHDMYGDMTGGKTGVHSRTDPNFNANTATFHRCSAYSSGDAGIDGLRVADDGSKPHTPGGAPGLYCFKNNYITNISEQKTTTTPNRWKYGFGGTGGQGSNSGKEGRSGARGFTKIWFKSYKTTNLTGVPNLINTKNSVSTDYSIYSDIVQNA